MIRYTITRKVKHSQEIREAFLSIGENPDNQRVMILPNWSNMLWDKKKDAEKFLSDMKEANNHEKLASMFGPVNELKVTPFECWEHGEAKSSTPSIT